MKIIKHICALIAFVLTILFLFPTTALAADIFSTTGSVAPEQDIYYVGDTVEIDDSFRNKSTSNATNAVVEYYYRLNGANSVYSGNQIALGTIASGTSKHTSFKYTFKESDIGDYRIGAKITYTASGSTDSEYSSGHDFIVMAAPTPTPTPSATPTLEITPTATATPTLEPTAVPIPTLQTIATYTPVPHAVATAEETDTSSISTGTIFQDKAILMTIIIVAGVIAVLLVVLIIVIVAKNR